LAKAVQSSFGSSSGSASTLKAGSTTYYGGEQRVPLDIHAGPLAQPTLVIAYGTSSAPTPEQKVLQQLIGGETSVKWSHGSSALAQAAAKVNGASAKSFLLPYSDASLFGVVVTAPTSEGVAAVAKDVTAALKAASKASGEEIKRAIAKAKFADAISREQQLGLVQTAGPAVCPPVPISNRIQTDKQLFSGDIAAPDASFAALEKVSAESVGKAATDLFKAKPTVVAVGDLSVLPYA
jgi:ubiquinol-cytochrome c reductase core subunit 2